MTGRYREALIAAAIFALAIALRVPGLMNELWLDEVWSLTNALRARSWTDVFTQYRVDNNHHLNTLWMYFAGAKASATHYRLLSFVCGVGTVVCAFAVGKREGFRTAAISALVFAMAYPLVYYSSEARGYAPVVFFTLAGWYCLREYVDRRDFRFAVVFWICSGLGILAHQTFAIFFIAALLWCDAHAERTTKSVRSATKTTLTAFVPPMVVFAAFYWLSLRGTSIAGGPRSPVLVIVGEALSLMSGGPATGTLMWLFASALAAAFAWFLVLAIRRGDDRWVLYAASTLLLPALFIAAQPSAATYARYFLVPGTFVLLAFSDLLSRGVAGQGLRRAVAVASLCVMAVGCLVNVRELFIYGRGRYDEAVQQMLENSPGVLTVASAPEFTQHDFRTEMLISYYAGVLNAEGRVRYMSDEDYPTSGTDWMIRESLDSARTPESQLRDRYGNLFTFDRAYKASALAGITWELYRNSHSLVRLTRVLL
jgi:hypothetical protein